MLSLLLERPLGTKDFLDDFFEAGDLLEALDRRWFDGEGASGRENGEAYEVKFVSLTSALLWFLMPLGSAR